MSEAKKLPLYQCHKKVAALKILHVTDEKVRPPDGSATIIPAERGHKPFKVSGEYMRRHDPQTGGYYVVYEDGYESYSPAKAFEGGYKPIKE